MKNKNMDQYIKKLKDNGYRITSSRSDLLELFVNNADKYYTLDAINDLLTLKNSKINTMSLYNNLKVLISEKIVQETIFNGKKVYELASRSGDHYHLYCTNCGRHIDVQEDYTDTLIENIKEYGFEVHAIKVEYFGLCKECQKNAESSN